MGGNSRAGGKFNGVIRSFIETLIRNGGKQGIELRGQPYPTSAREGQVQLENNHRDPIYILNH
jgi:hypothetical protein